jgi:hypothetical protein
MNKKTSKKLILSAETLRNLSAPDLRQVVGQSALDCTATHVCSTCNPCY